jgi:hypothetical protein
MEHEESIEKKLDAHIMKHDTDYNKLLWWIVGTLLTLLLSSSGLFISMGKDQERITQIENDQAEFVTKTELQGTIALFNNKIDNLSEKIDRLLLRP